MRRRGSKIAAQIVADYNKEREYREWLERKKQIEKEEKRGELDENSK